MARNTLDQITQRKETKRMNLEETVARIKRLSIVSLSNTRLVGRDLC